MSHFQHQHLPSITSHIHTSLHGVMANTDVQSYDKETLNKLMLQQCKIIGEKFYKFRGDFSNSENILSENFYKNGKNDTFINTEFDEIELIEENIDELIDSFKKIKKEISKTRKIKLILEKINN